MQKGLRGFWGGKWVQGRRGRGAHAVLSKVGRRGG